MTFRARTICAIVLALLSVITLSGLGMRGHFAPTAQFQAFDLRQNQLKGLNSLLLTHNESLQINHFNVDYNPQSQEVDVVNNTFAGFFSYSKTTAVGFEEDQEFNVSEYQYLEASVTTWPEYAPTSGFAFGLRFLANLENGTEVLLRSDTSPVEHVPSGGTNALKVYLPNYRSDVAKVRAILFYAEERAGIYSAFSIRFNSILASNLRESPSCSSEVCYTVLDLSGGSGFIDAMVADVVFIGPANYNLALSFGGEIFVSEVYSNGSSHVSLTSDSQNSTVQRIIAQSTPILPSTLYIISTKIPTSVSIQDVKLTLTPVTLSPVGAHVAWQIIVVLLAIELILVFVLPWMLLRLQLTWKRGLIGGVLLRLMLIPWTGHPSDTLVYIRSAYLYYHQGWAPIFYNPPTQFALSVPIGSMQFYYLLGLDRVDSNVLFHFGGFIATFFVKLPFLLVDVATATVLSKVNGSRIAMFYFLNPFAIYVSAVWGQYEGLTTLALIAGYAAFTRLRLTLGALASFAAFTIAGLVELFGFFTIPLLAIYLAVRKSFLMVALLIVVNCLILLVPSSISGFVFSLRLSNPMLQPGVYSFNGNFGINSQLPLITGVVVSALTAFYSLFRTRNFFDTLAPASGAIIAFEFFANNHPQLMLIPLGLFTLLFASKSDSGGVVFVWICGAILAIITIVGTQSFAYLLTGIGSYLIPQVEGGQHIKFYTLSLVTVDTALLFRAYRKVPLLLTSLLIILLIGTEWLLVNLL